MCCVVAIEMKNWIDWNCSEEENVDKRTEDERKERRKGQVELFSPIEHSFPLLNERFSPLSHRDVNIWTEWKRTFLTDVRSPPSPKRNNQKEKQLVLSRLFIKSDQIKFIGSNLSLTDFPDLPTDRSIDGVFHYGWVSLRDDNERSAEFFEDRWSNRLDEEKERVTFLPVQWKPIVSVLFSFTPSDRKCVKSPNCFTAEKSLEIIAPRSFVTSSICREGQPFRTSLRKDLDEKHHWNWKRESEMNL